LIEGEVGDTLFGKGNNDVVPGWMPLPNAMIVPKITLEEDLHNPLKIIGIIGWRQISGFRAGGNACQFFLQIVKDGKVSTLV
jgi:hypothetical protein